MSIYRTILEEDLELAGALDDDNCTELKEIEDIVDDQDANAFEQNEARDGEFGTDYGADLGDPEDIVDESFIAIAEAEMNFNKLMMAIGIHEVTEASMGRDIIYESVDIKGYLTRAKDWVVNFFKKVWQVLKRYAADITSVFKTNKQLATKYSAEIERGYKLYSANKVDKMKMWEYPGLDDAIARGKESFKDEDINKIMNRAKNWNSDNTVVSIDDVDSAINNYRASLCGEKCEASDFREKMHDHLYGKEKKEGAMHYKKVTEALSSGKEVKETKKAMDKARKEYKEAIRRLNELEKNFSKKTNSDNTDTADKAKNDLQNCVRLTGLMKDVLSASQVARASILSAARSRMMQARRFAHAYIFAANKNTGKYQGFQKELKNESTEYGFLSNIDLI